VVLTVGIAIASNLRGHKATSADDFGRLSNQKMQSVVSVPKKPENIQEAPVGDANAADPMLVNAADRARFLQADPIVPTPQATVASADALPQAQAAPAQTSDRVTIVDSAGGVAIIHQPGQQPILGGGFGRP
jgi:hypothetical protein